MKQKDKPIEVRLLRLEIVLRELRRRIKELERIVELQRKDVNQEDGDD